MSALSRFQATQGRGSAFVTMAALGLVIAADLLFYGQTLGWTAGLFTAGLLLALLIRPAAARHRRATRLIAAALAGLVLALVEEPTPLVMAVTFVAIVLLAMTSRQGWTGSAKAWIERWGKFLLVGWLKIVRDAAVSLKWTRRHPAAGTGGPAAAVRGLGKWVIPLLLGGVFVGLFAEANPVVERWVSHAADLAWRRLQSLPDLFAPLRMALWLVVLTGSWALLRVRTRRIRARRRHFPPPLPVDPQRRIVMRVSRHGLVTRCLIVFNLIFAMETALDLAYLTGGRRLPVGITFVQYAHRGAYPLIATTLLAAAFILIAFRHDCTGQYWRAARLLVYAWIAQNVMLTVSAGWRLYLLVNASDLTRLRLATAIWLALVAAGLLTLIWRIVMARDNTWLVRVNIAMTAAVLYTCCGLNLDGFIADYDADHCVEVAGNGGGLGLTYLRELGIESIPALERLSHTLDTPQRREMARQLADELRHQLADDMTNWRGWTWRRARLRSLSRCRVIGSMKGITVVPSDEQRGEISVS